MGPAVLCYVYQTDTYGIHAEEIMERRRPRKTLDMTKTLLVLIAVLLIVLIVVLCVAAGMNRGSADPGTNSTESTGSQNPSGSIELEVSGSLADGSTTVLESVTFTGTSDPAVALTVNGQTVERNADGSFSCQVALNLGENQVVFVSGQQTVTFTYTRRYVIESYSPAGEQSYNSGASIYFEVTARSGSTVTAEFNGDTLELAESGSQLSAGTPEGFSLYTGQYKLTGSSSGDLDLGSITYTARCDGVTETCTAGPITCLKASEILSTDPGVTPSYGNYINVGSGYIAEIVTYSAETFDGKATDDYSHPTNAYLPKGTVDYCSTELVVNGNLQYVQLRCGKRVYLDKKNIPSSQRTTVTDCYAGTLPDHNEISFVSMTEVGNHTVLTLDCLWKAPFYFDLKPQTYAYPNGGADRSYEVTACTATYIDITFCYATQFTGTVQIPAGSNLFKSAELIRNESDCTLRLHLNKTGGFYGWDCFYNDAGQLCFQFLNPAKVSTAGNAYGANLSGVTIMLDVGHGGVDGGAAVKVSGKEIDEAERNLTLANALKTELESMGATVILNRSTDVAITVDDRIQSLKNAAPDLCIAIHHNSLPDYPNWSGFECYYYDAFSKLAAEQVYKHTNESGIYKACSLGWHNYFVARQTTCPVVLTENGYLTNEYDLNNTLDTQAIAKKAQAIAQGVADYFLQINP